MNRVAKIIIYALVLFLLYLWISTIAKSCNDPGTTDSVTTETDDTSYSSDEEIYDEFFESDEKAANEESKANSDEWEDISTDEPAEEEYNEDFSFEKEEKTTISRPTKVQSPSNKPTNTGTNANGKYIIVAGSYLIKDNADKMVARLKKLGYSNAEVINFDASQYHTISAAAFNTYEDAGVVAKEIKNQGIDCYVHTKK